MSSIEKRCDFAQSIQNSPNNKSAAGHLLELKICNFTVTPKIFLINPITQNKEKVVGVITKFSWGSGIVDPILLECTIPYDAKLATQLLDDHVSNAVELKLAIYEYSQLDKKYYSSVWAEDESLTGVLRVESDERLLNSAIDQHNNLILWLAINPEQQPMIIETGVGVKTKKALPWGERA